MNKPIGEGNDLNTPNEKSLRERIVLNLKRFRRIATQPNIPLDVNKVPPHMAEQHIENKLYEQLGLRHIASEIKERAGLSNKLGQLVEYLGGLETSTFDPDRKEIDAQIWEVVITAIQQINNNIDQWDEATLLAMLDDAVRLVIGTFVSLKSFYYNVDESARLAKKQKVKVTKEQIMRLGYQSYTKAVNDFLAKYPMLEMQERLPEFIE